MHYAQKMPRFDCPQDLPKGGVLWGFLQSSIALSVEEAGLMTYLQSPPDAGPPWFKNPSALRLTKLEVCRKKVS